MPASDENDRQDHSRRAVASEQEEIKGPSGVRPPAQPHRAITTFTMDAAAAPSSQAMSWSVAQARQIQRTQMKKNRSANSFTKN